jgi:hypothetical protein
MLTAGKPHPHTDGSPSHIIAVYDTHHIGVPLRANWPAYYFDMVMSTVTFLGSRVQQIHETHVPEPGRRVRWKSAQKTLSQTAKLFPLVVITQDEGGVARPPYSQLECFEGLQSPARKQNNKVHKPVQFKGLIIWIEKVLNLYREKL